MENIILDNLFDKYFGGAWDDSRVFKELKKELQNTSGKGKLYKYRPVNKKSLEALQEQVLYCSPPSAFNDPFDCKAGIDLASLSEMILSGIGGERTESQEELNTDEEVALLIRRGKGGGDYSVEERERIEVFRQEYPSLYGMLKEIQNADISGGWTIERFAQDPNILREIGRITGCSDEYFKIIDHYGEFLSALLRVSMQRPDIWEKKPDDAIRDIAEIMGVSGDVDGITLSGKIAAGISPGLALEVEDEEQKLNVFLNKMSEKIDQEFTIGCLAEDYKNRLMWSHYADSHKGFCIEYDFSEVNLEKEGLLIFPVCYSENRSTYPWEIARSTDPQVLKEASKKAIEILLKKDSAWSYEKEWRLINPSSRRGSAVRLPCVSRIYLGACCKGRKRSRVISVAKRLKIPVSEMWIDRGKYELHTRPIDVKIKGESF